MSTAKATFTRMDESTAEEWSIIMRSINDHAENHLADSVLAQMQLLASDDGGFAVDRLAHCLQTAYLAEEDGKDEEYVVCALLHDIGDILAPLNHTEVAAAIIKPYVSPANHWMVQHHGTVQGYYFWHHIGLDRNARDALKGHEFYDQCEEFCAKYDMPAFDPDRTTPTLDDYAPMVRNVLTLRQ